MRYSLAVLLLLVPLSAAGHQIHLREFRGAVCYDGDTCYVTMYGLPAPLQSMSVRIRGIDTPERRGKCSRERARALYATGFINSAVRAASKVEFRNLEWGKYGGRLLADLYLDGVSYVDMAIEAQPVGEDGKPDESSAWARRYLGGSRRGWCGS